MKTINLKLTVLTLVLASPLFAFADAATDANRAVLLELGTDKILTPIDLPGVNTSKGRVLVQDADKSVRAVLRSEILKETTNCVQGICPGTRVKLGVNLVNVTHVFSNGIYSISGQDEYTRKIEGQVDRKTITGVPTNDNCSGSICKGQYFTGRYDGQGRPILSDKWARFLPDSIVRVSGILSDGTILFAKTALSIDNKTEPYVVLMNVPYINPYYGSNNYPYSGNYSYGYGFAYGNVFAYDNGPKVVYPEANNASDLVLERWAPAGSATAPSSRALATQ